MANGQIYIDKKQINNFDSYGIHYWKFKIIKIKVNSVRGIYNQNNKPFQFTSTSPSSSKSKQTNSNLYSFLKQEMRINDIVQIRVNNNQHKLSFNINNNEWTNIDNHTNITENIIHHEIGTFVGLTNDCIQLLEYQYSEKEEEQKISKPKLQNTNTSSLVKLKKIQEFEKYKYDINALERECSQHRVENKSLKDRLNSIKYSNMTLQTQNEIIPKLQKEIEQLRTENEGLRQENIRLKMQFKAKSLDLSQYKSWNWQEMLQWILSIDDSRFNVYETQLRQMLNEEKPTGDDLGYVTENDIKRWGITNFRDIKIVLQNIKKLVNDENMHNENIKNNNENSEYQKEEKQSESEADESDDDYAPDIDLVNDKSEGKFKNKRPMQYVDEEYSYSASDEYYEHFAIAKGTSIYIEDKLQTMRNGEASMQNLKSDRNDKILGQDNDKKVDNEKKDENDKRDKDEIILIDVTSMDDENGNGVDIMEAIDECDDETDEETAGSLTKMKSMYDENNDHGTDGEDEEHDKIVLKLQESETKTDEIEAVMDDDGKNEDEAQKVKVIEFDRGCKENENS